MLFSIDGIQMLFTGDFFSFSFHVHFENDISLLISLYYIVGRIDYLSIDKVDIIFGMHFWWAENFFSKGS